MDVIKNCLITNSDAKILREYCIDKTSPLYRQYKGFNTSLNLEASDIYSMYSGFVSVLSGDSKYGYDVVVQMNFNQSMKYGNLKSINVKQGQTIDSGQKLGTARRYVKVEYLTTFVKNQYFCRIGDLELYKDDPAKVVYVENTSVKSSNLKFNQSGLIDVVSTLDGGSFSTISSPPKGRKA